MKFSGNIQSIPCTVILYGLLLLFFPVISIAQSVQCGTTVDDIQESFEINDFNFQAELFDLYKVNKTISLSVHVVLDAQGNAGVITEEIDQAVSDLNTNFEEIGVKFQVCTLNYIENYHFNTIYQISNETNLIIRNHIPNTINLYIVSALYNSANSDVCAYTYMPGHDKDNIFIRKGCLVSTALTHQVGHLFNLYHTHEIIFGNEKVERTNCLETGDLCCDTEADPGLSGTVTSECSFFGAIKDDDENFYVPSVTNYMSDAPDHCKCRFSEEQLKRMLFTLENHKGHLR